MSSSRAHTGERRSPLITIKAGGRVRTCGFTADGSHVYAGGLFLGLEFWNWRTGRRDDHLLQGLTINKSTPSRGGRLIAVACGRDEYRTPDVVVVDCEGRQTRTLPAELTIDDLQGKELDVDGLALTPDASVALVAGPAAWVRRYDLTQESVRMFSIPGRRVAWAVALDRQGRRGAVTTHDAQGVGTLYVVDFDEETVRAIHEQDDPISTVRFSPDERVLIFAGWDGTVRVLDRATSIVQRIAEHHGRLCDLAVSADGRFIAVAAQTGEVWGYDRITSRQVFHLRRPLASPGWLNSVAFAPDSRHLVTGGDDGCLCVWSLT